MMVNPLDQNDVDLESSILHYFIWKVANLTAITRNHSRSDNGTTNGVSTGASSGADSATTSSDALLSKYKKIIEVMQTELHHVDVLDCVMKSHDNEFNYPTIYNLWKTCHSYQYTDTVHLDNKESNSNSTYYCDCNSDGTDDTDVTISKMKPTTKKARIEDFSSTVANVSLVSQIRGSFEGPVGSSNHRIADESQAGSKNSTCSTIRYKRVSVIRCPDSTKSNVKEDAKEKDISMISNSKKEHELIAEKGIITAVNTCQIPSPKCRTEQEGEKRTKSKKAHTLTWSERFDQLVQFHKEHDHFIIPRECKEYPWLWDWVYYQRKNYSSNKLKQERVDKLNSIGFDWESPFALKKFESRIADCFKLKETSVPDTADTLVSSAQGTEEDKDRRQQDRNCNKFLSSAQSIREEYMRRLGVNTKNNNNVCEDKSTILNKRFADRATELKLIKDICGTVNQKKCILAIFPNNTALLQWMKKQRIQYQLLKKGQPTTLTRCRKEILDELGFDYEPRNNTTQIASISSKKETKIDANESSYR